MNSPKRMLLAGLLAASCLTFAACPAPAADFKQAVALYNQKQYSAAATAFAAIMQTEPKNLSACLYLANCYYSMGKTTQANYYYQWLSKSHPESREGATAAKILNRTMAPVANAPAETAAALTNAVTKAAANIAAQPVDARSILVVTRPLGDHPACSGDFLAKIKEGISAIPPNVVAFAAKNGVRICATPTLIDRNPELRNSRPRGYEDGGTYKNTPAMFENPYVVVCEYALIGENDDQWHEMSDPVGSMRHEFGHAVDCYLDYPSYSEEFRHIYYLDRAKIEAEDKEALSYYVQAGTEEGGPSETFAQACCIIFGGNKEKWRAERNAKFERYFPNVLAYVRKKLKSIS